MATIIELLGLLAPVAALALLIRHRRRAPLPAAIGLIGVAIAALGSLTELVGSRAAWFGGSEGALERLEEWSTLRFDLVLAGTLLLFVAALLGRGRAVPRLPLALGGAVAAGLGLVVRLAPIDLGDDGGVTAFVTSMAVELAQFGMLGAGILLISVAVVSGRDDDPEPLREVVPKVLQAVAALQQLRGTERR